MTACSVGIFGEVVHQFEELRRLSDEKSHGSQELQGCCRSAPGLSGAHDGTGGESATKERCWLRHDQVRLKLLASERRRVEVREHQRGVFRISEGWGVSYLVAPRLEVHGLSGPDAEHDAQDVRVRHSLR